MMEETQEAQTLLLDAVDKDVLEESAKVRKAVQEQAEIEGVLNKKIDQMIGLLKTLPHNITSVKMENEQTLNWNSADGNLFLTFYEEDQNFVRSVTLREASFVQKAIAVKHFKLLVSNIHDTVRKSIDRAKEAVGITVDWIAHADSPEKAAPKVRESKK